MSVFGGGLGWFGGGLGCFGVVWGVSMDPLKRNAKKARQLAYLSEK